MPPPTNAVRRARRPAGLSADKMAFLQRLREVFPSGGGTSQAAILCGKTAKHIDRWRWKDQRFRDTMDALKMQLEGESRSIKMAAERAAGGVPPPEGIDTAFVIYLQTWRELQDRAQAWERAGLTWAEVKQERETNPAFEAACAAVEEEFAVRIEDANNRKAMKDGGAAANAFLKRRGRPPAEAAPLDLRAEVQRLREKGQPN